MGTFFSQFAEPHGKTGYLAGWFMSKENKAINKWTIDFLGIQDDEHILEIGFGSGKAMKYVLEQGENLTITGMDPSGVMVYQALRQLNKRLINGQIRLIEGKAENMPHLPQKIDKVLVINNVTFWEAPVGTLENIRSQMNIGGKIALTIRPHEKGASDETSELIGGQLSALLTHAGFNDVEFFLKPTKPNDTVCALGTK
ncbi:Methyltransferase domain-containing protein [Lentibacillus persicus]|uniref:Methyltransferase domain-containing protein n=1 Tax=Lentibacillus persicus TaxID=640948 RepID=A0A1I1ZTH8_9BACI|nr:class I SAM-dependent methyltransferase [Lentibacillus persicus]SFE34979.1 Methyltransferase domain-containing protein [Lentibacillus persicus]